MKTRDGLRKKAFLLVGVIMSGFISTIFMTMTTYATYYSSHTDTQDLQEIAMYYEAAVECMSSSKWQSYTFNLSSRSDTNNNDALNYFGLNASKLFSDGAGSNDSNLLYSEVLESKTSGGHDDGKLYCSELNIYPYLLQKLGIFNDADVSKLICNGKEPGIMKVTAGYGLGAARWTNAKYDGDKNGEKDWPAGLEGLQDGADCGGTLTVFLDYIRNHPTEIIKGSGNGNTGYGFNIKFEKADDAADYFEKYIKPYLGKRSELSSDTKKAMNYWNYYKTFELGCAKISSGQLTKPAASSDNMIGIYDAASGKVYYHSLSNIHQSDKQYYEVYNTSQMTCAELAEELGGGEDGELIDDSDVDKLVIATGQDKIKGCFDEYKEVRGEYLSYYSEHNTLNDAGKNFVKLATGALDGVGGTTTTLFPAGWYIAGDQPAIEKYNARLAEYLATITGGINGGAVFANNVFVSLKAAIDDILSKTNIASDGTINGTTATEQQLNDARALLDQASAESDRVEQEHQKLLSLLNNDYPARNYSAEGYNSLKGELWDVQNQIITCPGKSDLVNDFNALNLANPPDVDAEYNPGDYDSGTSGGGTGPEEADCLSSGAAGSLGWIACPTISGMAEATDGISGLLNDWLSIDTKWYDPNDSNGAKTYEAWEIFRNIANIVMIIILLAIVFSQLTGVGIDNYGIKKMLPKLIIMAILINLGYIICEVVIDLSNILGTGLNKLFTSIGESIGGRVTFGQGATTVVASILGVGSVAGMGAATVIPIAVSLVGGGGAMVIISLILILLIALVAVLLFFASIGARMIIVILFTAISPLAFACYILPNTQTLFKKWLNVFKAAVLVYPICGALYGMARLVNNLIFSGSGTVGLPLALIGVCAPLIPFFALPSLLKGALTGLGVVGGALTAMSAGLKKGLRGANSAVQGTDQFKNAQNRGKVKTGAWSSKKFRDRMDRRIDNGLSEKDRKDAQELRNKIRNNTASDEEKKQYNDIIGRSRNKLTEGQTARLADAQAKINAYESQKEKETNGADDVVAAGMRQKDSYSNQNAADEARNWTESYYRDNDGNVWVSDGRGKYHTVDKNGNKREMSSGAVREALNRNKGVMVSRRDAMLNQDFANRAKQSGALAGYANESRAQAAAFGGRLSSLETSQSGLIDMAQSGQDNVLQIQHDANVDKRSQVAGRAQAAANFRAQGLATTVSKEAAIQAAEKQFENVAAQNLAADDYASKVASGVYDVRKIRDDAVLAGAIKAVNQTTNAVADNRAGEVVISQDVADLKAKNKYTVSAAEEKAYSENLADLEVKAGNAENLALKRIYNAAAENDIDVKAPNFEAIKAERKSKYNKEAVEAEMARIKLLASLDSNDQNYLPVDSDRYAEELGKLMDRSDLDSDQEIQAKAFATLLANSGGYGQKLLAKAITKHPTQKGFMSGYMSKDSNIAASIALKDPALAQYMRDVNTEGRYVLDSSGNVFETSEVSFEDWLKATRLNSNNPTDFAAKDTATGTPLTNARFVVDKVADKDIDLIKQSDGAFEELMKQGAISDERLSAIYNDKDIYNTATAGIRKMISDRLGRPFDQAEYKFESGSGQDKLES